MKYRWNVIDNNFPLGLSETAKFAMERLIEEQPAGSFIKSYEYPPYVIIEVEKEPTSHPVLGIIWEECPDQQQTIPIYPKKMVEVPGHIPV